MKDIPSAAEARQRSAKVRDRQEQVSRQWQDEADWRDWLAVEEKVEKLVPEFLERVSIAISHAISGGYDSCAVRLRVRQDPLNLAADLAWVRVSSQLRREPLGYQVSLAWTPVGYQLRISWSNREPRITQDRGRRGP